MKGQAMPSPDAILADMAHVVKLTGKLADLAQVVGDAYEDLYDGAFRKMGPTGDGMGINRPGAPLGDPTGDVALSGLHKRLRWRARSAATQLRICLEYLEQAENIMVEAWAEQDAEFREKLDRIRQLEDDQTTAERA